MQITLNQTEVEQAISAYMEDAINVAGDLQIHLNEDGTATVLINEEVVAAEDNPPVVEKKQRRRRTNPAEAKHVPVEAKKELEQPAETQTSTGGQNESSTQEAKEAEQGVQTEPTEQLKEEATEQAEEAASEEASQEAEVKQEVQEEKAAEAPPAKPSLFANLKR